MKLSEHFDSTEFNCRCCGVGGYAMNPQLISGLEILRERMGHPVKIISGFRCWRHNQQGSNPKLKSRHLSGEAADVRIPQGKSPEWLEHIAESIDTFRRGGIGIYSHFVHVDVRWVSEMSMARWGR